MNLTQKVAYNTGIQMTGRAVSIAVGLVTLRLQATYLGIQSFGEYSEVLAVAGATVIVADLGVTTILARELAKKPEDVDTLGGNLLFFRLVTSLLASGVLLLALPLFPYTHETKVALAIFVPSIFLTILGGFPYSFFQTNLRLDYAAVLDVSARLLGLAAILVVRLLDLGLYGLVSVLLVVNLTTCFATFAFSRQFWRINIRFSWPRAKPLIRASIGIGFIATVGLFSYRGDAIWLSLLRPASDVGIYTVAYRFVDQAFMVPGMFIAAVFPIMTRALHSNEGDAKRVINRTFRFLALAGGAMTIALYVLAPVLVRLAAGDEFGSAARPLQILSFAMVFLFTAPVFYNILVAINKLRALMAAGIFILICDIATNLILIPKFGYNGCAIATVSTETLATVVLMSIARRHSSFGLERSFILGATGAGIGATVAVVALESASPWLSCAIAEAVFCLAALGLGAVKRAEAQVDLRPLAVERPGSVRRGLCARRGDVGEREGGRERGAEVDASGARGWTRRLPGRTVTAKLGVGAKAPPGGDLTRERVPGAGVDRYVIEEASVGLETLRVEHVIGMSDDQRHAVIAS